MFKYLWILIVLVFVGVFLYFLYNAIKEAVDYGYTNIEDIIDYIDHHHENVSVVLGLMFILLCTGLIFLFGAFGKYYWGNNV